ncbi:MAG: type II secretion system F family protein [Anaerolineae bacterium]
MFLIGLIVVLVVATGIVLFFGFRSLNPGDQATQTRLDQFVSRDLAEVEDEATDRGPSKLTQNLDLALEERGFAQNISTQLAQADLRFTAAEYVMLIAVSILGLGAIAFLVYRGNLIFTLGGAVAGYFLPGFYVRFRRRRRMNTFNDQLGDAINLLANGLRSGYSLLQAIDSVSSELSDPISYEFRRVVQEVGLGISTERAFNNLLRRMPSDDLDLMITAISVQNEIGGNLAEILETIGHTIRERVRIKGEIRVLTAQQMISGYVISLLPIGLGLVLFAMNQEYMGRMFKPSESQPCGYIMIGIGVTIIVIGFLAIRKIIQIEV